MDQLLSEKERISSNINDMNFKLSFSKIHISITNLLINVIFILRNKSSLLVTNVLIFQC